MANRTLYMDLNGKLKRGFENGQKWKFKSANQEMRYALINAVSYRKAKAHKDYEYWNKLASA